MSLAPYQLTLSTLPSVAAVNRILSPARQNVTLRSQHLRANYNVNYMPLQRSGDSGPFICT